MILENLEKGSSADLKQIVSQIRQVPRESRRAEIQHIRDWLSRDQTKHQPKIEKLASMCVEAKEYQLASELFTLVGGETPG